MIPFLLAAAISYTLHAKDVFQPPKPPLPEMWSSGAKNQRQTLEFRTREGTNLRGWLYKSELPDMPYVIFFYGSNEDLTHEANRLAWLRDSFHVNAICFDYPGYGFSGGSIDVHAILAAAVQEFDYVRDLLALNNAPVIAYGWSIGSGVAVQLASIRPVSGLILQAPSATSSDMAKWSSKHDVPGYARWLVKIKFDSLIQPLYDGAASMHAVKSPLLVIHGQLDDVVPIAEGKQVFQASPAVQKQFVEVPGAHHNDLHFTKPPASTAVGEFLKALTLGK